MSFLSNPEKNAETIETDVLVVGSGAAALMAGLHLDGRLKVLVASKFAMGDGCTAQAQGGIACVTDPEDSAESHLRDTLYAGDGLCVEESVRLMLREAPSAIAEIADPVGFDRDRAGRLLLGKEGAHSFRRILHAGGDATGKAVEEGLLRLAAKKKNLRQFQNLRVFELLTHEGKCGGAEAWNCDGGGTLRIRARATVLATGGYSQLFQETTNPATSTGDGVAMALRSGARARDLEFVQFHPTALFIAGAPRFLISEAVRGAGGILRNASGHAFMQERHELGDLAPRDVVSRCIVNEMIRTRESCVFLDLTHLDATKARSSFPNIHACCRKYGVDISRQWIPVRPAAHYTMGGVIADADGRTDLANLYACGEVASTGVHGANRLASNSLLEALVFGRRVGRTIGESLPRTIIRGAKPFSPGRRRIVEDLDPADLLRTLKAVMWRNAGVFREGRQLDEAYKRIRQWMALDIAPARMSHEWLDFQNLCLVGLGVVGMALARRESRGAHFRRDYPARDDAAFSKHSVAAYRDIVGP